MLLGQPEYNEPRHGAISKLLVFGVLFIMSNAKPIHVKLSGLSSDTDRLDVSAHEALNNLDNA